MEKTNRTVECGAPDLRNTCQEKLEKKKKILHTGLRPPFRFCVWATSCVKASTSTSGVETDELTEPSGMSSDLVATDSMAGSLLFCVELEGVSTIETIGLVFLSFFLFLLILPDFFLFFLIWERKQVRSSTKPEC